MLPAEFVSKWYRLQQKETALYASHFDDLCRLAGHITYVQGDTAVEKETRHAVSPAEIKKLDDIHRALDAAVAQAYGWVRADGWPEDLSDEALLERLLTLKLERAGRRDNGENER